MTSLDQIERDLTALIPRIDPKTVSNETLAYRRGIMNCLTVVRAAVIEDRRAASTSETKQLPAVKVVRASRRRKFPEQ